MNQNNRPKEYNVNSDFKKIKAKIKNNEDVTDQEREFYEKKTEENKRRTARNNINKQKREANLTDEQKEDLKNKQRKANALAVKRHRERQRTGNTPSPSKKKAKTSGPTPSPRKKKSKTSNLKSPYPEEPPVINITFPLDTVTSAVSIAYTNQEKFVQLPLKLTSDILEKVKNSSSPSRNVTSSNTKEVKNSSSPSPNVTSSNTKPDPFDDLSDSSDSNSLFGSSSDSTNGLTEEFEQIKKELLEDPNSKEDENPDSEFDLNAASNAASDRLIETKVFRTPEKVDVRDKIEVGCFAHVQDYQGGTSHMAKIVGIENDQISFQWYDGSNVDKNVLTKHYSHVESVIDMHSSNRSKTSTVEKFELKKYKENFNQVGIFKTVTFTSEILGMTLKKDKNFGFEVNTLTAKSEFYDDQTVMPGDYIVFFENQDCRNMSDISEFRELMEETKGKQMRELIILTNEKQRKSGYVDIEEKSSESDDIIEVFDGNMPIKNKSNVDENISPAEKERNDGNMSTKSDDKMEDNAPEVEKDINEVNDNIPETEKVIDDSNIPSVNDGKKDNDNISEGSKLINDGNMSTINDDKKGDDSIPEAEKDNNDGKIQSSPSRKRTKTIPSKRVTRSGSKSRRILTRSPTTGNFHI